MKRINSGGMLSLITVWVFLTPLLIKFLTKILYKLCSNKPTNLVHPILIIRSTKNLFLKHTFLLSRMEEIL